ncbi:MAG: alpha/beta fold hydrolase, partial [Solirubrobacteraceae bacterium]
MSLAHDRRGSGPPLVLIHPLGADRHVWRPVLDRVAEQRDAIAIDLPGFGGTPPLSGGGRPDPAALARRVA